MQSSVRLPRIFSLLFLTLLGQWGGGCSGLYAQNSVGIGTDAPNPNAVLHLVTGEAPQGLLIPALTTNDRTSAAFVGRLSEAEDGLLVYDADERQFYHWAGDRWDPLASGQVGGDLFGQLSNLQLDTGVVRFENMADSAVSSSAIIDNTIQTEDLASPGANKVLISTDAGTVFWENLNLFETVSLMEGFVYVGSSNNQPIEVDMSGRGSLLVGNGTSATSVRISGDGTLNESGLLTLSNSEQTRQNLGLDQSNVSITGGTISGTVIGADDPAPGSFTQISGNGSEIADLDANNITTGTIGVDRLPNVSGDPIIYGDATQNNPITAITVDTKGRVTDASVGTPSDQRLKRDWTPLHGSLAQLQQIQPYTYSWKEGSHPPQMGVMAQEVEEIYPELIATRSDGYKTVNYIGLIPPVLNALQEQQEQIEQLESRLRKQEKSNQVLRKELMKIKQMLNE